MAKTRTNLTLSRELRAQLADRPDLNWSEIAEAALWRSLSDQSPEAEACRLRSENRELRYRLNAIIGIATGRVKLPAG